MMIKRTTWQPATLRQTTLKRKIVWLALVSLLLTLLVAGAVQAQESQNFNATLNSLAGGGYGGGTMESASYKLVVSTGTHIQVSSTSAGYELCSGFICQSNHGFFQMRIPVLSK